MEGGNKVFGVGDWKIFFLREGGGRGGGGSVKSLGGGGGHKQYSQPKT